LRFLCLSIKYHRLRQSIPPGDPFSIPGYGAADEIEVSGDVRLGGDPVQELARFVTLGRRFRQKEPTMAP
jgi:hypothetical protein